MIHYVHKRLRSQVTLASLNFLILVQFSLRPYVLQRLRTVQKVVRIRLGNDPPLVRLLHKVLVALLVRKVDGGLLALEVEMRALHEVGGGLPAHQGVLPSVAFGENVPVHAPVVAVPVAGLGGGFGGTVDSNGLRLVWRDRKAPDNDLAIF